MISAGIVVRIGCSACGSFFDADLDAVKKVRGGQLTLIGRSGSCPITTCRGQTFFTAAASIGAPLMTLVDDLTDPLALNGLTALQLEPPPPPNGGGASAKPFSLEQFVSHIATRADVA